MVYCEVQQTRRGSYVSSRPSPHFFLQLENPLIWDPPLYMAVTLEPEEEEEGEGDEEEEKEEKEELLDEFYQSCNFGCFWWIF